MKVPSLLGHLGTVDGVSLFSLIGDAPEQFKS